ncbi:hypothetical protein K2173_012843 (mitochondrion) [Erythroxylum novogranatense]|uniref:Uncharacterized protein n=1 Tax=Erythroxylum novogranatense TaxID=1862640 RepID=A0AAV8S4H4_9ROSI|nr:hypothetical protein K2173_012843 [Erythroxylum novogranatense]
MEVGLRCNRTPSYCARSYTEVLPAGCWNDASRARPRFRKMKGQKVEIRGYKFPISLEAENESTSRFENTFFYFTHAERARRKISVEEKQPSSFPSLPGKKKAVQSFLVLSNQILYNLVKSRIWGYAT